jgi:site-specific DNA-methyltransferase (cytosine-N4-specific)
MAVIKHVLADDLTIYQGDVRESLKLIPDESVQTCVTSPPYYGLRDYGTGEWEGGDPGCDHQVKKQFGGSGNKGNHAGQSANASPSERLNRKECPRCGARRVDRQIGLEDSVEGYVDSLVRVFREVKRVLRKDGTLWLNLGDSYNGSGGAGGDYSPGGLKEGQPKYPGRRIDGLKPKDLIGIPWRVAFALQADGWYLRSDARERH